MITAIDKSKTKDICVSCPRGYQNKFFNAIAKGQFQFGMSDETPAALDTMKQEMFCTNTIRHGGRHDFGSAGFVPNRSNVSLKGRLLGSYVHHSLKRTLATAGKAIQFMLRHLGISPCSVISIAEITRNINNFYVHMRD